MITDDVSEGNWVLEFGFVSFIGPMVKLEITQSGIVCIDFNKLVNVFIQSDCWCFVPAVKIDAKDGFSF